MRKAAKAEHSCGQGQGRTEAGEGEAAMGGQGESLLQAGLSAAENTGPRGSYSWVVGMRGSRRRLELAVVLEQSWA